MIGDNQLNCLAGYLQIPSSFCPRSHGLYWIRIGVSENFYLYELHTIQLSNNQWILLTLPRYHCCWSQHYSLLGRCDCITLLEGIHRNCLFSSLFHCNWTWPISWSLVFSAIWKTASFSRNYFDFRARQKSLLSHLLLKLGYFIWKTEIIILT